MIPSLHRFLIVLCLLSALVFCAFTAHAGGTVPVYQSGKTRNTTRPLPRKPSLNRYQRNSLERLLSRSATPATSMRVIAIQVQFADSLMGGQPGSHRPELRDSTFFAGEAAHMSDYFDGASRKKFTLEPTVGGVLYTLSLGMGYYGRDIYEEERVVELAAELIALSDDDIDFSQYDHVFIIHAGAGQETDLAGDSPEQIWSSFYDSGDIDAAFPDSSVAGIATMDSIAGEPVLVDNFSIVPANASQDFSIIGTLGIWSFQIGNRIGMIPLFDSTPGLPDSQGVGNFCVMSYGLFNINGFIPPFPCAFNRMLAGWLDPITIDAPVTEVALRLTDVNTGSDADTVAVRVPISGSEYFLVVNRVHDANFDSLFTFDDTNGNLIPEHGESLVDAEFDFFLTDLSNPAVRVSDPGFPGGLLKRHTGSGVYVWHIDENVVRENLNQGFLPNDFVDRKGVDLEEADGVQDMDGPGIAAYALGGHFDSYRAGDGNQTSFALTTSPNSRSNTGVETGIIIDNVSAPDSVMTLTLRRDVGYAETRTRWTAPARAQPATPVDFIFGGDLEIVVAADTGAVFVFDASGTDMTDLDNTTIDPYISAPGELWVGPPAFGRLIPGGGPEIVLATKSGRIYAWQGDGSEVADGDLDGGTNGVLYIGMPMAAPPLLVDVDNDDVDEILIAEIIGDSVRVSFIGGGGAPYVPTDPDFSSLWPWMLPGQRAVPMALAATERALGAIIVSIDSLTMTANVAYTPFLNLDVGNPTDTTPWLSSFAIGDGRGRVVSAPAVADIDFDNHDEIVMTTRDGKLIIYEADRGETGEVGRTVIEMWSTNPSAPSLGDVDGDGPLEIALWDDEYMYLFRSNGGVATNWPQAIIPSNFGEQPPVGWDRLLETPTIGDLTGNGRVDIMFPLADGNLFSFEGDARRTSGFPRVAPGGISATAAIAGLDGGAESSIIMLGTVPGLAGFNSVVDTFATQDRATLSIQSLPGSDASDIPAWGQYQHDLARSARTMPSSPLKTAGTAFTEDSFFVYPNPVRGATTRVRVTLNTAAQITVGVYNIEGEETFRRVYSANPNGLIGTPFDESIDVSQLVSGVYFIRLRIESAHGTDTLVKTFAIRR